MIQDISPSSEDWFQFALQAARAGIWNWNMRSGEVAWSSENYVLYGRDPALGPPTYAQWEQTVHPDDRDHINRLVHAVAQGQLPEYQAEFRIIQPTGSIRWLLGLGQVQLDTDGTPIRMGGVNVDITERKRGEQLIQRNHDTFHQLIERNPFGVYVVDADFRLKVASLGAQKVFLNVRPLLGRDFAEVLQLIWPAPFAGEAIARFRHTLQTGEPYAAPSTVERRSDIEEVEAYDWRIERIELPDGRYGVVCYFYDLSERQQWETALRESEERFRSMANDLPLIVWVHDEQGRLVFVNNTYCTYFGVSREEMRDSRWRLLTHPDDGAAYADAFLACVHEHRPFHSEVRVRRGDGAWRWMESWGQPRFDSDGQFLGHLGTSVDITERKYAEHALREASERKDEFLATLAHELRNPLAPIRSAVHILNHENVSEQAAATALDIIDRQTQTMARLVDDLMDVSRIAHGKLQLRKVRVALASVMKHALDTCLPYTSSGRFSVVTELPPEPVFVYADPVRLAQVFANLLSNACKYAREGAGHIQLAVTRENDLVSVSVRDNGIGISASQLSRIFEMFAQEIPATSRSPGGLGIGLALARGLVQAHGGSIEARSAGLNCGAEFIVRMPMARDTPSPAGPDDDSGYSFTAGKGVRILVVDDNQDGARSLAALLRIKGFEVSVAFDGVAALQAALRDRPDVVLLDLGMPGLSGFDVCKTLRARSEAKTIAIIAVSGLGQQNDRHRSAEAGFDAHFVKPVAVDELLALLGRLAPTE